MQPTNNQIQPQNHAQPAQDNEPKGGSGMSNGVSFSYITSDLYSIDGFTRLAKVLIADIHLLSLIPAIGNLFNEMLKTIEAQKDILYATAIFNSWYKFFDEKNKKGLFDNTINALTAIGDFFETGCFLKKYAHFQFPLFSRVAENIGNINVFSYRWGETPVLRCLCEKPKDFFVFIASTMEVGRWGINIAVEDDEDKRSRLFSLDQSLKITASFGKMILIASGKGANILFLSLVDVVTQNVSIARFLYQKHQKRVDHFGATAA